jgi:asparagine synthase (glutamine-hydrolysing)
MCRIAGLVNPSMPLTAIAAVVKDMCSVQKHGGPDDEGLYINGDNHLVLGHRRLSIIDLSMAGHQPMAYDNGRYQISYNGEIYNYAELKNSLIKLGCIFTTTSDTEVILAAFATWGTEAFAKFNGMFAFALLDNESGHLFLVRDAAGIKPLYFAHTKNGLAFASEVRAFKSIPYLQTPNPYWQVYLMAYGHLPEPITTLIDVQPLKKGWYLKYTLSSGQIQQQAFNRYSYMEQIDNREEAILLIQQTLAKAIKSHLLSDAPIGVFLSGGLDSSIVSLLANEYQDQLKTISLYFDDSNYSEKKYQDIVQQKLNGNQYQQLLTEEEFHTGLPGIIKAMDLPSCDGINTWFISKYARERGLKAVLSGIGGDELYGGYPSFSRIQPALAAKQHLPNALLRAGRYTGLKALRRLCYLSIPGSVGMYLFLRGQFIPSEIAAYLNVEEQEVWRILETQPQLPDITNLTPKNQASWLEANLYMQNQLLRDVDVMSMANGVEIRVPFLEAAFLKLSLKICSDIKYPGAFKKQLLIDSFKSKLPEQVWNRPKMGFAFPFKDWLMNDQYAEGKSGAKSIDNHKKFMEGNLHWSQFLTVFLMENHTDA